MKNDDSIIPNVPEINITSPSSSPRDQVINTTSEGRGSSSSNSSGSSPSELRRRLQDLPSPNEFTILTDRVAALGRRICRKRELFLRLHGVADRIEESDEWEEREQKDRSESSLRAFRSKDARARRRARIRLESSSRDDKAMVISQSGGPTGPSKVTDDDDDLPNPAMSSADRSARDRDYLRLPAIEVSRRQSSSLSEPSSARFPPHSNGGWCDIRNDAPFHSYRDFTSTRDNANLKSTDRPSVSPFAFSNIRQPKKFGGYRPPSGLVLKNLSSSSESESINEANREILSAQRSGNMIATLELSSPETKVVATNEPTKKMPIMSARSDITGSILPNLLPSTRSCCGDSYSRIHRDTDIHNERESCNKFLTEAINDQVKSGYENISNEEEEMSQPTFSATSFISKSVERVTRIYNKQSFASHDEPVRKISTEQVESGCEDKYDEKEKIESHRSWSTTQTYRKGIEDRQFGFNRPTNQSDNAFCENNTKVNSWRNVNRDILDRRETVDSPYLNSERIQNDTTEEALSSQTSEPFGSEDHSRSPYTPKTHLQRKILSRPQNDSDVSDKRDQEIATVTKVPTLALNSQDISYSTSAGSRECSAMRPLDPHALIKALSDVSLKQGKRYENASRKCDDFYQQEKDTIDISCRASDFLTKGETWRVQRSSESPRKPLSRVPSRIPVRISSSKITSSVSANKFSEYRESSNKIENYEEAKFIDQNGVQIEINDNIVQRSEIYSEKCKQNSSLKSRNNNIEVTIVTDHIGVPDDEVAGYETNDYEPASLTSSNQQSPQSTPLRDHIYREMPESRFSGKSCPPMILNEAAYSSDRDFSRIDDDVRSDRSTSRKSAETIDITSVTESPYLSRYKSNLISRNQSLRVDSSRNAEKNLAWGTEDECASINDEENHKDVKDRDYYESHGKKPEDLHLQTKERFKTAVEEIYDLSPSKSQSLQIGPPPKHKEISKKQRVGDDLKFHDKLKFEQSLEPTKIANSENFISQMHKTHEISSFNVEMPSSVLNLSYEMRRKRKSQERFPFTISEASVSFSTERNNTTDYQSPDKNAYRTKIDDKLKENTVPQLKIHPSITRLATAGLEDTVTEILYCAAQNQKEEELSSKSGMKRLIRIFCSKLRRTSKQRNDVKISEPAKVIYENCVCQVNSRANSSSSDLSAEETHKMNLDKSLNNRWVGHYATGSNSLPVSGTNILKKTESLEAIPREHLHRRFDQDDLWVQDIKEFSIKMEKDKETLQKHKQPDNLKKSSSKDRYSILIAKNLQSDKLSESNIDYGNRLAEQHDILISDHVVPSDIQNEEKRSIYQKTDANFVPEEIEDLTGCFCLRLCHLIGVPKYRLSIKEQTPSIKVKKSASLLQKRKN